MKKSLFAISALALIFSAGAYQAKADTFSFSFSGPQDSGSGIVVANPTGTPGVFTIVGGGGTTDGLNIVALLAPGTYPSTLPSNDNLFYDPATGHVDLGGVSYQLEDGTDINVWFGSLGGGTPSYYVVKGPEMKFDALTDVTVTPLSGSLVPQSVSPTPEPSSLMLLGTGIIGAAGMVRRRFTV